MLYYFYYKIKHRYRKPQTHDWINYSKMSTFGTNKQVRTELPSHLGSPLCTLFNRKPSLSPLGATILTHSFHFLSFLTILSLKCASLVTIIQTCSLLPFISFMSLIIYRFSSCPIFFPWAYLLNRSSAWTLLTAYTQGTFMCSFVLCIFCKPAAGYRGLVCLRFKPLKKATVVLCALIKSPSN